MYVWIALAGLSVAVVAVASLLYQVLRQQGRILLSMELLERRVSAIEHPVPAQPQGIPVGELFPSFRFPDVTGRMIGLEDYRGRRAVLVHWSPSCGFCDLIASDL